MSSDEVQDNNNPQLNQIPDQIQQQQSQQQQDQSQPRKPKAPSVRRACSACHQGKTRCSEVLPCQSCLKRGMGASCAYPEPGDNPQDHSSASTSAPIPPQPTFAPPLYAAVTATTPTNLSHQQYFDYNGAYTGASSSSFRPNKRPRNLTEEETAAIRNYTRGDFFVGTSAPVRIDTRLPVRLTLGEGDHVHFTVGEPYPPV